MKYVIGIDIGGTSIKWSAVNEKGEVYEKTSIPVIREDSQDVTIDKLIKAVINYIDNFPYKNDLVGIGMGVPGAIDGINGICKFSNNLRWHDLHIVEKFKAKIDLPIRIANDADAAALGESLFGSGKEYNSSVLVTLGTGFGSGIVLNNKLYLGNGGMGMELGHMCIEHENPRDCTCGRKGCLETYASATALIFDTKEAIKANPVSILSKIANEDNKVNGETPFKAMALGCPVAKKVIDNYISKLCLGLLSICCIYRPEVILLSGGIANSGEYLFNECNRILKENNYGFAEYPPVFVKKATLGYNSGIIGAASLILE